MFEEGTIRETWRRGHDLLVHALKIHPSFERITRFLDIEPQFLLHLGMFNTNNINGALYPLHTHINHSCSPNTKVVDTPGRLAEVNAFVQDNVIGPGEEITISYVDPTWPTISRRQTLKRDYGFECGCSRCVADLESAYSEYTYDSDSE